MSSRNKIRLYLPVALVMTLLISTSYFYLTQRSLKITPAPWLDSITHQNTAVNNGDRISGQQINLSPVQNFIVERPFLYPIEKACTETEIWAQQNLSPSTENISYFFFNQSKELHPDYPFLNNDFEYLIVDHMMCIMGSNLKCLGCYPPL